jgi:hypothetical protein
VIEQHFFLVFCFLFFLEFMVAVAGTLSRIFFTSTAVDFSDEGLSDFQFVLDLVGDQFEKCFAGDVYFAVETAEIQLGVSEDQLIPLAIVGKFMLGEVVELLL